MLMMSSRLRGGTGRAECSANCASMCDFARFDGAQLIGAQRKHGQGFTFQRDELNFVAFFVMDEYNRPQVASAQAVFRQISSQNGSVEFFHHSSL